MIWGVQPMMQTPGGEGDGAQRLLRAKDRAWCRAWELLHLRSWQGNEGKDKTVKFKEEKRSWAGWRGERMWTD